MKKIKGVIVNAEFKRIEEGERVTFIIEGTLIKTDDGKVLNVRTSELLDFDMEEFDKRGIGSIDTLNNSYMVALKQTQSSKDSLEDAISYF
jgi:hypothetical protein